MLNRIPILFLFLTTLSCEPSNNLLEAVSAYQEFGNDHNIEKILMFYADSARLDFGPMGIIEGKEAIRGIHEYDQAINTTIRMVDCQLEDTKVRCRTTEQNDWLRTAGIARIEYSESLFTFNTRDKITTISATLDPESADSLGMALSLFGQWAQENEADRFSNLFRDDGSFVYSFVSGEEIISLLKQWRSSSQADQ